MKQRCPICGAESDLHFTTHEIAYFGEILISTAVCTSSSCGYRSTDVMVVGESNGEGAKDKIRRNELEVFSVDDLNATVVRSSFASIEIPELGVRVEPKRGEAFVSNVEGVLQRVEKVVEMLSRDEEGEKRAKAAAIVKKIAQIKAGEANMTLILDDPTGNSAIISDKVKHHRDNDQKSK